MTVRAVDVSMRFPGTLALDRIDLEIRAGEVHGIVGENGAGKTTFVSILAGLLRPTGGHIEIDGRPVRLAGARDALANGIAYVSQEGSLVPFLTGAENILLGSEPTAAGMIRTAPLRARANELARHYFPDRPLDLDRPVGELDYADQKIIEILRALNAAASVLILDEPTASLPARDAAYLTGAIRELCGRGLAVVLISHFLAEVIALSDRISVLRDGKYVATVAARETDEAALVGLMLAGGAHGFERRRIVAPVGAAPRLAVAGWSGEGFADVDLAVAPGEIVGLIGLSEAGQVAFAESLYGAVPHASGTLAVDGRPVAVDGPAAARAAGIAFVPDRRMIKALVGDMTVRENLSLVNLRTAGLGALPVVSGGGERREARAIFQRLDIRARSVEQGVAELSGGNKQKVSVGRWLFGVDPAAAYKVVIFVEPTEGVDIGAKAEIHSIIAALAASGLAVIVVSSDLLEIEALADRVVPFAHGRMRAVIPQARFAQPLFIEAMAGS